MKVLLIYLFACLQNLPPIDCASFYEKELKSLLIKGTVIEKKLTDDYYIIKVKQDDTGKQISFKLLKNNSGREIYWFAIKGSIIRKKSGHYDLHFLNPTPDGGYKGRIFDNLCK